MVSSAKYFCAILLFSLAALFFISPLLSINQDIGRHIKLGEIISDSKEVPKINLFSYTLPQRKFINHHWLSEVIFYQIQKAFGLESLIILKSLVFTASLVMI